MLLPFPACNLALEGPHQPLNVHWPPQVTSWFWFLWWLFTKGMIYLFFSWVLSVGLERPISLIMCDPGLALLTLSSGLLVTKLSCASVWTNHHSTWPSLCWGGKVSGDARELVTDCKWQDLTVGDNFHFILAIAILRTRCSFLKVSEE